MCDTALVAEDNCHVFDGPFDQIVKLFKRKKQPHRFTGILNYKMDQQQAYRYIEQIAFLKVY